MNAILRFLIFVLAISASAVTWAQPAPDVVARQHFERGKQLTASRKFADAYREFEAGYRAKPLPAFLFNMAEAARAMGEPAKARSAYERFLAVEPTGALADTARKRLGELDRSGTAKPSAEPAKPSAEPAKPSAEPAKPSAEPAKPSPAKPSTVPAAKPSAEPAKPPSRSLQPSPRSPSAVAQDQQTSQERKTRIMRWSGGAAAGVGLGLVGLGIYHGVAASHRADELEQSCSPTCTWGPDQLGLASKHDGHRSKAIAFSVVGAAAVVAGGVVSYLGWRRGVATEPSPVAVDVTRGRWAVVWTRTF